MKISVIIAAIFLTSCGTWGFDISIGIDGQPQIGVHYDAPIQVDPQK